MPLAPRRRDLWIALVCVSGLACGCDASTHVAVVDAEVDAAQESSVGSAVDFDDDRVLNIHEDDMDTDRDGIYDAFDRDSDGDTISDRIEAGDDELATPPVDSDGDGVPDLRDLDSDNDGLSDLEEAEHATDRTRADSDGDGVSDFVEVAAHTSPNEERDHPAARGDFLFFVPFRTNPVPARDTFSFDARMRKLDVYFGFDVTPSMHEELAVMRDALSGVPALVEALRCGGRRHSETGPCMTDVWTGVGVFDELGSFRNLLSLQPDAAATALAIPRPSLSGSHEAPVAAATCVADETQCPARAGCAEVGVGCPGFRASSIRVYVQITDADDQCAGDDCARFTPERAGEALSDSTIHFMSFVGEDDDAPGGDSPDSLARRIAHASGTLDRQGAPYVFRTDGSTLVADAQRALERLAFEEAHDFVIEIEDDPNDAFDARHFVESVDIDQRSFGCENSAEPFDWNGDGVVDGVRGLSPGRLSCWTITPRLNEAVVAEDKTIVFSGVLRIRAEGGIVNDTRRMTFVVPVTTPMRPVLR